MKTSRRKFISAAVTGGVAATLPFSGISQIPISESVIEKYEKLDKILQEPVFKKELFNLRFQKTLGELTNTSRFAKVRKNIARVETELTRRRKVGAK